MDTNRYDLDDKVYDINNKLRLLGKNEIYTVVYDEICIDLSKVDSKILTVPSFVTGLMNSRFEGDNNIKANDMLEEIHINHILNYIGGVSF